MAALLALTLAARPLGDDLFFRLDGKLRALTLEEKTVFGERPKDSGRGLGNSLTEEQFGKFSGIPVAGFSIQRLP